ncbi:hypothetical protein ApAK_05920 [Thermoplasmatales archaeon AK]|nr:hypothetical protein [Thermoplasmatales archaeon AK]
MTMRRSSMAVAAAVIAAALLLVPASTASSVTVHLSPSAGSAFISADVTSTLTFTVENNSSSTILYDLAASEFAGIAKQVKNDIRFSMSSSLVDSLQTTLANYDRLVTVENGTIAYTSSGYSNVTKRSATLTVDSTLSLYFNITGIYSNKTANLSWRAFDYKGNISYGSTDINRAYSVLGFNSSHNFLNFSAYSVSLNEWKRTYDPPTNTTEFSYQAGSENSAALSYSDGGYLYANLTIDPSYSIITPGYAVASGNSIQITGEPVSSAYYYAIAVILVIGAGITIYMRRKRF